MNQLILNKLLSDGLSGIRGFSKTELAEANEKLKPHLIGSNGLPKIVSAEEVLSKFTLDEIRLCMQANGIYVLPTVELLADLKKIIPNLTKTIEIGSGNGVIADQLGIKATDNYMQSENFRVEKHHKHLIDDLRSSDAEMVKYGKNVLRVDGNEAVKRFRPETVLACFVTHKYSKAKSELGGNFKGVDFEKVMKKVKRIVFVGNTDTHKNHTLMRLPLLGMQSDGLITRSFNPDNNGIFIIDQKLIELDESDEMPTREKILELLSLEHLLD